MNNDPSPKLTPEQVCALEPTPTRNEPCPCGSGKKFKRCCSDDNPIKHNEQREAARIEHERRMEELRLKEEEAERFFAEHPTVDINGSRGMSVTRRHTMILAAAAALMADGALNADLGDAGPQKAYIPPKHRRGRR